MSRDTAYRLSLFALIFSLACSAEPRSASTPTAPGATAADSGPVVATGVPGSALPGLSPSELAAFGRGMQVFATTFTPATGLGPLFNSTSCAACHDDPVLGGYGDSTEVHASATHGAASCTTLGELGGPVVQQHVTPELLAALGILKEPMPAGATGTGFRTTPVIFGLGLLDAVADQYIIQLSRIPRPDGIHGRPAILANRHVGRFGRKATVASLTEFNAGAFFNEMGVTNLLNRAEGTVAGARLPSGVDLAPDPEIDEPTLATADAFVRFLAPVAPLPATDQTRHGAELFDQVHCSSCHVPVLTTGNSTSPALRHKRIAAYTDLLLHNMGEQEADMCNGVAGTSEFRTQPLMGMQFLDMFMHDGLAETVDEDIMRHGGEGAAVRARFQALTPSDQAALVAFVAGL